MKSEVDIEWSIPLYKQGWKESFFDNFMKG